MATYFRTIALIASTALAASGCLVEIGDGNLDDGFGGSAAFDDEPIDHDGSDPGTGGSDPGTGGTDPGTGGTDPGTGGGEACSTEDADPYAWELCESLPMAPSNLGGTCSDGMNAIGYDVCLKAYEIFNPSDADHLHSCLAQIPAENACAEEPVVDCIDATYETACVSEDVTPLCESWSLACTSGGDDSFDLEGCVTDLNAMNHQAIDTLSACIADAPNATCGDRYEACLDALVAL